MKKFLKLFAVSALGGAIVGASTYNPDLPFTSGNVLFPIGAGMLSGIIGLFTKNPFAK